MWIVSLRTIAAAEYERGKAMFVDKAKIKIIIKPKNKIITASNVYLAHPKAISQV